MKNASRLSDIRVMTEDQLNDEALKLKKEQFNLRFQKASGQLQDTARVRVVRRDIARVMTVAAQKRATAKAKHETHAEENFAGLRRQRQAREAAGGEGRTPVHTPAIEEDRAPVEELPRARRKQDPEGRRHRLDRGDAPDLEAQALDHRRRDGAEGVIKEVMP